MPTIRVEPALLEAVLQIHLEQSERTDQQLVRDYHSLVDPLYARYASDERENAFTPIHRLLFEQLGYIQLFNELWAKTPELDARANGFLVLGAPRADDEGAVIGRDGQSVCLRILPRAADMLNPAFGYEVTREPAASNWLAERYRVVWCAHVDARLTRRGIEPLADYDTHWRAFDARFVVSHSGTTSHSETTLAATTRRAWFEEIWNAEKLTHAGIVARVREFSPAPARRIPGALCPLCGFPTHRWADDIPLALARAIQRDFPDWQVDDGACERCIERYTFITADGKV